MNKQELRDKFFKECTCIDDLPFEVSRKIKLTNDDLFDWFWKEFNGGEAEVLRFGTWYSGMDKSKVANAYKRFKKEQPHKIEPQEGDILLLLEDWTPKENNPKGFRFNAGIKYLVSCGTIGKDLCIINKSFCGWHLSELIESGVKYRIEKK